MKIDIRSIDHIVLAVADVAKTCEFYQRVLGLRPVENPPGRWALHFGSQKISLQPAAQMPHIASRTTPGSGNFCLLTPTPIKEVVTHLESNGVELVAGPGERIGAAGRLLSVYFFDPDGNLVEVANVVDGLD